MKTVRISNGSVVEIIPDYALPPEKWYGKEFASQCVEAPDDVEQNWSYDKETQTFSKNNPAAPPKPEETYTADDLFAALLGG